MSSGRRTLCLVSASILLCLNRAAWSDEETDLDQYLLKGLDANIAAPLGGDPLKDLLFDAVNLAQPATDLSMAQTLNRVVAVWPMIGATIYAMGFQANGQFTAWGIANPAPFQPTRPIMAASQGVLPYTPAGPVTPPVSGAPTSPAPIAGISDTQVETWSNYILQGGESDTLINLAGIGYWLRATHVGTSAAQIGQFALQEQDLHRDFLARGYRQGLLTTSYQQEPIAGAVVCWITRDASLAMMPLVTPSQIYPLLDSQIEAERSVTAQNIGIARTQCGQFWSSLNSLYTNGPSIGIEMIDTLALLALPELLSDIRAGFQIALPAELENAASQSATRVQDAWDGEFPNQALAPILQSQAIPLVSVGEKNGPSLIQAQQFLMGTGAIPGNPRQSLDAIPVSMKTSIGAAMVANRLIVRCGSQVRSGPTANAEFFQPATIQAVAATAAVVNQATTFIYNRYLGNWATSLPSADSATETQIANALSAQSTSLIALRTQVLTAMGGINASIGLTTDQPGFNRATQLIRTTVPLGVRAMAALANCQVDTASTHALEDLKSMLALLMTTDPATVRNLPTPATWIRIERLAAENALEHASSRRGAINDVQIPGMDFPESRGTDLVFTREELEAHDFWWCATILRFWPKLESQSIPQLLQSMALSWVQAEAAGLALGSGYADLLLTEDWSCREFQSANAITINNRASKTVVNP